MSWKAEMDWDGTLHTDHNLRQVLIKRGTPKQHRPGVGDPEGRRRRVLIAYLRPMGAPRFTTLRLRSTQRKGI